MTLTHTHTINIRRLCNSGSLIKTPVFWSNYRASCFCHCTLTQTVGEKSHVLVSPLSLTHCAKHQIKLRTLHAVLVPCYRRLDSLSSESKWAKFSSANLAERGDGDEMCVRRAARRRPTFSEKQNWKRTKRLSGPNGSATRAEWNAPETRSFCLCVCTRTILERAREEPAGGWIHNWTLS
jgi:hypothetical protein